MTNGSNVSSTQAPVLPQRVVKPVAHGIFDTTGNSRFAYFQFLVPYGASDARLTGTYRSYGGYLPEIFVDLVQSGSSNGSRNDTCRPYYFDRCLPKYLDENKVIGNINVELPSDRWYYLSFYNAGWLGELRQVEANIDISYDIPVATNVPASNVTD
jgi:hypothetical protein